MATPQPDILVNRLYVLKRDRALCLVMLDLIQDHAEDLASLDTTQHKDLLFAIASTLAHLKRNLEDTHQELCVWLEAIPPTGDKHAASAYPESPTPGGGSSKP